VTADTLTLTIDELAGGGDGVGRSGDRAVFVPDTTPGDRVRVQVLERRRSWWRATVLELLEPGPGRRDPACPLSLVCGGCGWHHVRYDHQLTAKAGLLARAFRQARVHAPAVEVRPAPTPLGYRCRARLQWRRRRDTTLVLGFLGRRSHHVVDLTACPVLLPHLSSLLPALRAAFPSGGKAGEVHLLGNLGGQLAIALHGVSDPTAAAALGQRLAPALRGVRTRPAGDKGSGQPTTWGSVEINQATADVPPFWTTPEIFFQANSAVNEQLCELITRWAGAWDGPCVELFAGSGNLTRGLARQGPVIAVESDPGAAALARRNLTDQNVEWLNQEAEHALEELTSRHLAAGIVVLDPPRSGARNLLDALARLRPPRVIYVSCDPMTLARDVAHLAGAGYLLARVSALDTMPQTHHFETVAELRLP